ncbi:electron transfer flavoprotein subunit beta/FixA family protein [Sebaldella sp. S0638]|uniref:electron transfer flavoprotein subunit beta/FixA family protein n=1 Tax=Sebaldella sp. S0638 TaxID=2957809 RepID=UPI0020A03D51|nr:electron transfer flavoprotein subunit beta/FixA family protein [Sebaldella sp. S0638]MCP1223625.1 electron transfer flavoprotein subunit beta/FixA family protein [Sebaldella sp. S0638]
MNILVCFKAVPDFEMMSEDAWNIDSKLNVDMTYVRSILNCFDESALEMTLRLSDLSESLDIPVKLSALTIAGEKSDVYLKNLYALKFQEGIRIENNEDIRFFPEVTASVISRYAKEYGDQDVLILGRQSSEGDNAKTPLLVSEMLGWPCITQVTDIKPDTEKTLRIASMTDEGILTQTVETPVVISVGNAPVSHLRVPTLKDKMKYGKTPVKVFNGEEFGIRELMREYSVDYEFVNMEKTDTKREGIIIKGDTPGEKTRILYEKYLKERLEKL